MRSAWAACYPAGAGIFEEASTRPHSGRFRGPCRSFDCLQVKVQQGLLLFTLLLVLLAHPEHLSEDFAVEAVAANIHDISNSILGGITLQWG